MKTKGFTIIEILIVIFIAGFALAGLMGLYNTSLKTLAQNENKIKALNLASESLEITRALRNESWNNISNLTMGSEYYPSKADSPMRWVLNPGTETQGVFSRKIIFENVYRDSNDNIVTAGGTLDPNTKKVSSIVTWPGQNITFVTYLTNWR